VAHVFCAVAATLLLAAGFASAWYFRAKGDSPRKERIGVFALAFSAIALVVSTVFGALAMMGLGAMGAG
jgi:hypothetical protein